MFRSSHFLFLVTFGDEVTKIWKNYIIFVDILLGKTGLTEKKQTKNHAIKVTKIPKTKRQKYGMKETIINELIRSNTNLRVFTKFIHQYCVIVVFILSTEKNLLGSLWSTQKYWWKKLVKTRLVVWWDEPIIYIILLTRSSNQSQNH